MIKEKNKKIAVITMLMVVIGVVSYMALNTDIFGGPTIADETADYEYFDWEIFISTEDGSVVGEDLLAKTHVYDGETFVEAVGLSSVDLIYTRLHGVANIWLLNTSMNQWRWVVMLNNGTIDDYNPENNFWNGTIHMNQHMNRNTWERIGYESSQFSYGFKYTYNGYIVEIRLTGI